MAESATSKVSEAPRTAVGRDGVLDIAARLSANRLWDRIAEKDR